MVAMSQKDVEVGDTVVWKIDNGLFVNTCEGEVLETDIQKFGYSDVMKVQLTDPNGNSTGNEAYVRPKDLE